MRETKVNESITTDAEEFGVHVRQGGWRLGLLVARNVEKGTRGGDRTGANSNRNLLGKVDATAFARKSGTSPARVLRYLDAWERAADDGHVPHAADLVPGEDVDLDAESLPQWNDYYSHTEDHLERAEPAERAAIERAASEAGTTPAQVARVAASIPAIGAAIAASPEVAHAAREALVRRDWDGEAPPPLSGGQLRAMGDRAEARHQQDERHDGNVQVSRAVYALLNARRDLRDAASVYVDAMSEDQRRYFQDEVEKTRAAVELVHLASTGQAQTTDWDAELLRLAE